MNELDEYRKRIERLELKLEVADENILFLRRAMEDLNEFGCKHERLERMLGPAYNGGSS